jgi:SPX domain protein involved in polyphosphate accumulation
MITKTFKRYEIKYFVTPEQFITIKAALEKKMVPDEFCKNGGSYMIYNLYFDTENDEIIRRSLDKPYFKEKLRLRSYTMPTSGEDIVFLELKKKIGGIVAKRRAIMSFTQASDFLEKGVEPELKTYQDKQVLAEISSFLKQHQVKPKVFISYERVAYTDKDDPDFRVSFDSNILTRRNDVSLTKGDYGSELLDSDALLMEIKCGGTIPFWLCRMLSDMKIYKTNFSKYGAEYKKQFDCPWNGKKTAGE